MLRKLVPPFIVSCMALCLAGTVWAQFPWGDNPPTFQNLGMLDTQSRQLTEADCRTCHDSGVPDRHHLLYDQPIPQGTVVPYPDSDGDGQPDTIYDCLNCHDPNFNIVRDCLACHNTGSPHHTTQYAFDRHCSACHGSLVDDYDDGHYIPTYASSLVTPYRGLDGDGYENPPWRTQDLQSDGGGAVVPADVTVTVQGPPFFTVTSIGPLGTIHTRTEPNDLSFKPAGDNNDFVIRSARFLGETFHVEFQAGPTLGATWNSTTQTLRVALEGTQLARDLVDAINTATGGSDVEAVLGFDGDSRFLDVFPSVHYEPQGGAPANNRNFGAGSCSYCHDTDGILDANGHPDGLIWDNHTLHHEIGLPSLVNDGAGGTWSKCNICHDLATMYDQSGPAFDLHIRKCAECHGPDSLHNIQADSNSDGTIVVGGEDAGYGHVGRDAGAGDSDCWGCHGFERESAGKVVFGPVIPTLHSADPTVVRAGEDATLLLAGAGFLNEAEGITYESHVRLTAGDGSRVSLAPVIVDESLMSVTIPGDVAPGNYRLQAVNEERASKPVVISVNPRVIITEATAGRRTVTIRGSGFGGYAEGSGSSITAQVATARGKKPTSRTVEGNIVAWSGTTIVAEFTGRPKEVTVHSIYGTARSAVRGKGRTSD